MTVTLKIPTPRRPKLPKLRLPNVSRNVADSALQAVGVFAVLIGVSLWSVPSAWVLGGLVAVLAVERQAVPRNDAV